jgi:hypothetical protein
MKAKNGKHNFTRYYSTHLSNINAVTKWNTMGNLPFSYWHNNNFLY